MKTFVVIPTYNESINIGQLIDSILEKMPITHIIIIDDNSPDNTSKVVKTKQKEYPNKVHLLLRKSEKGRGSAGIAGFRFALKQGADAVIEMDADFSHHPKYLKSMINKLINFDVVVGSRFVKRGIDKRSFNRRFLTIFSGFYTRLVLGINIKDPTSGFRAFNRKALESIKMDSLFTTNSWTVVQEMLFKAYKLGFKIYEMPIVFEDRKNGNSKLQLKTLFKTFYLLFYLRLKYFGLSNFKAS
ncbi:MAG: hypothetical protein A3D24_02535 [Candidatus Blackburnbacteria bacterium RIFCSPHIGHO2_02_FULL_39_13]|uniref:Glycosyltransferase 2-like domain-containing protein n=1 Tax=Candidatus Blackburnbacteria bacterium RIFCSPLOWO2_01_FULL_40_20 TaxID=1797519 RepID=A0A1G1VF86_9BACT|nr:MAG: hypothetical protein A2694_00190 [Candidatus Blackburnbacteria bacterium RIFCSPHIGHO2_01_FULL_40_17]OGY09257.1 MAG: hypothetical protein A3D24_02535 [Candidatus Blackburnbacteria bacterium RIFCSPHIGHO2_02_FULL_39_13]OGY13882.1 MAG: hypothetical protein A3A77_01125 [Candidatus Blackburnbacteria bacterium RIFCSPLOWO2_01_FULL_40_20]OGY14949.1 MAG: hypothetical protein A3I52_02765 [Candidatus Blackburnbacteria bacterium RIFCSPLOWO2_02_FULL_40_10]HBL51716.1 dolichyl-phosphate beta-D-mannosyl